MIATGYAELLRLVVPEVIVVVTALAVLVADRLVRSASTRSRLIQGAAISCIGCVCAIASLLLAPQFATVYDGSLVLTPQTRMLQIALLGLTALVILLSTESKIDTHVGEYLALILFAATSTMFLVATQNILLIFLSLELLSLSLYVLTAFNKRSARSAEAALRYFLFGGMSAAFTLFGLSILYGLSNSTNLLQIGASIKGPSLNPLLIVAVITTIIGFGFKIAAVPFHFWAPDVYQAAPAGSAALIASASKVASFAIFYQVLAIGFAGADGSGDWGHYIPGWVPAIGVVAALSMVFGNLVAITQTSVRRLLAYSAIAHAGYILLAFLSHTQQSFNAVLYYIVTYALAVIGAFGVISVVEERTGGDKLSDFAGLSRREPVLSLCMLIFLLSLAGIPPLAGFFGKFYLFTSALSAQPQKLGLLWLVVLAIAMSAVSLYYYLQVLKRIYVTEPSSDSGPALTQIASKVVLCFIALTVVLLGCAPNLFLQWLR